MKNSGHFEFDPHVEHHFSSGLYAKQMFIPAGHEVVSHKHTYDHFSILAQGTVIVRTDRGGSRIYDAPACVEIVAGQNHAIEAVSDAVWFCIHATDVADPDRIDETLIQPPKAGED